MLRRAALLAALLALPAASFAQDALPGITPPDGEADTDTERPDSYAWPDPSASTPLEGEELRALFQDQQHEGYYDYRVRPDGDFAFTEMMNADGTTLHIRDGERSRGQWRIMSNVVCFSYDDMNGGCFNLYQRGNCNYAFSVEARDFVAVTVAGGETPNCEPAVA